MGLIPLRDTTVIRKHGLTMSACVLLPSRLLRGLPYHAQHISSTATLQSDSRQNTTITYPGMF